jgi:hypothetical protein
VKHLVVGAGEVGRAVYNVLRRAHDVAIRDIAPMALPADMLHVCFPWSPSFVEDVRAYVRAHRARVVVVYSTVPVGVCDEHGWVHSPVTGKHPHLEESLLSFRRVVAGRDAGEVARVWEAVDRSLPVVVRDLAADTEAGKLWELIQYGIQVRVEKAIWAWCEKEGLDPDYIYGDTARAYNAGYASLGYEQYVRPVLEHVPGPIGGHCVTQNAALIDHPLARLVVDGDD